MLQKVSYFNLIFAIIYVLIYFRDSTLNFTIGILMIVIFNWLALRSYELNNFKWKIWHYLSGLWSLYYIGFLLYGAFNILLASFEYEFVSNDTLIFLALSYTLSTMVLIQFLIYAKCNYKAIKADRYF